jgi:hypothetical protein
MRISPEPTLEDIREAIINKVDINAKIFEPSILSVYQRKENSREKPAQIGTAFVVNYKNNQYLVTAQHVIQQALVDGHPEFLSKSGKFFSLKQVKDIKYSEILNNDLDFYITKIINNSTDIDGINIDKQINQTQHALCLAIGYPNSRNKTRVDTKNKTAKSTCARLTLSNRESSEEIISDEFDNPYFLMSFKTTSLDKNWNTVNSIGIRGMSGSPCFNIPFGLQDIISDVHPNLGVNLVGLLIEMKNEKIKFLKFSKIFSHFSDTEKYRN